MDTSYVSQMPDHVDRAELRRRLADAGMRDVDVARHLGISRSRLSNWMTRRHAFPQGAVVRIARLLQCPVDSLMHRDSAPVL